MVRISQRMGEHKVQRRWVAEVRWKQFKCGWSASLLSAKSSVLNSKIIRNKSWKIHWFSAYRLHSLLTSAELHQEVICPCIVNRRYTWVCLVITVLVRKQSKAGPFLCQWFAYWGTLKTLVSQTGYLWNSCHLCAMNSDRDLKIGFLQSSFVMHLACFHTQTFHLQPAPALLNI